MVARILKPMSRSHVALFRATGGRFGGRLLGKGVCLLTTTGRKSGLARTNALLFVPDGDRIILVAAQGGLPRHPHWLLNIRSNPDVTVEVGNRKLRMRAREATETERGALWPRLTAFYPGWARYQSWTDRVIPVVICEPA